MSVEATTSVTTPIAPVVTPAVDAAVAPVAPKVEEAGSIGAGPAQATPAEGQAKKLYIVA